MGDENVRKALNALRNGPKQVSDRVWQLQQASECRQEAHYLRIMNKDCPELLQYADELEWRAAQHELEASND